MSKPPETDAKTGQMINPHNPEFITKKPWYLAEGGDGGADGPTLDHQADQRREEDRQGITLSEADRLVKEERDRIKRKLEKQKLKEKSRKKKGNKRRHNNIDDEEEIDTDLFEIGMWIEALRKNKKPYLIAQIVKISDKGRSFDLKYEDGYIERNVKPASSASSKSSTAPRMRVTRTGNRSHTVNKSESGKETYDSKRDAYHGVEVDSHMKKMEEKYREREALRKQQRQKDKEAREEEMKLLQQEVEEGKKEKASDSDSGYDSDNDGNNKNHRLIIIVVPR